MTRCIAPTIVSIQYLNISQKTRRYGVRLIRNGLHLFRVLNGGGYDVTRSHIDDGQDFFEYEPDEYDVIVSNPPFSIKDKILERLYELNKPFAVLLPTNSLQGKKRYELFKQGIQLLCFDSRIGFHYPDCMDVPKSWNSFSSSYFCRDVLPRDLIIEKLNKYDCPLK